MAEDSPRRVALVTGAARGIGAATTRRLVAEGYAVLALDWCAGPDAEPYPMPEPADLHQVAAHGEVEPWVADVRDRSALVAAVAQAVDRWGRLDAVVANAGIIAGGRPQWETTDADLGLLWDVNVRGVWNTAAASVPRMLAGPDPSGCRFVAIASAAGRHGLFHLSAYNAVKHAVVGLVKGLAADLAGTGVTATAVVPGSTRTPMLDQTARLYRVPVGELASHQQLRRIIEPDEVAEVVAMCCSAAGAVTNGGLVPADGGFPG